MDTLLSLVKEYLVRVNPKGPGWGTCYMCMKAGGEHFPSCLIGRMAEEVKKHEKGRVQGCVEEP